MSNIHVIKLFGLPLSYNSGPILHWRASSTALFQFLDKCLCTHGVKGEPFNSLPGFYQTNPALYSFRIETDFVFNGLELLPSAYDLVVELAPANLVAVLVEKSSGQDAPFLDDQHALLVISDV